MTIQITRRASLGLDPGAIRTLATATEAALVADREAIYTATPNPAGDDLAVRLDPTSGQIVSADGGPIAAQVALSALVSGAVISGAWRNLPASGVIMRARMTGTGILTMDSATGDLGAGTVTTAAYAATVAGTQLDDYAYPGDAARSIRFMLTGSAAVEVY